MILCINLPKKGNLEVCDNWRGITLLSVPGKVLCRIILKGGAWRFSDWQKLY